MTDDEIRAHVEPFADRIGGPIRALQELMQAYGVIVEDFLPIIAEVFNISRAEVRGIVSFYEDFRTHTAHHRIRICQAESCQAMGSRALSAHAESALGVKMNEATEDLTLEPVYCLGNCTCSPSVMIDDKLYSRVDASRFDELIKS